MSLVYEQRIQVSTCVHESCLGSRLRPHWFREIHGLSTIGRLSKHEELQLIGALLIGIPTVDAMTYNAFSRVEMLRKYSTSSSLTFSSFLEPAQPETMYRMNSKERIFTFALYRSSRESYGVTHGHPLRRA